MNKNLFKIGSLAIVAIAFSACSHSDMFEEQNEANASQNRADYVANFIKKYGEVDPNQSWDLSSMQPTYSYSSGENSTRAITRGTRSVDRTISENFTVEGDILDWFFTNLPAGKNNRGKGDPFYMTVVAGEPLTIVPIFQGNASKYWQLWMHVNGVKDDVLIWAKGEQLGYRMVENGEVIPTGVGQAGVDKDAYEVVAPAVTFTGLPVGNDVDFYLKAWKDYDTYTGDNLGNKSTKYSSLKEKMLALNCDKPKNAPANQNYCIIGCEDATDNDYEDLAILVYGKFEINKPDTLDETITKRYLIEDLGSKGDFDFNDVVVDVSQTTRTINHYKVVNGKKTLDYTDGPNVERQWAVVRAAGGMLDFTISIGSSSWTKQGNLNVEEMYNTGWGNTTIDYNRVLAEFEIENKDWDLENDNIIITVDGRGQNSGLQKITFPRKGEVPMIIAVDATVNWMKELKPIPGPKDEKPWWTWK